MRKIATFLSILIMLISFTACAAPANEPAVSMMPSSTPELKGTVVFTDPVLESMVRRTMGKLEGSITAAEAEAVTRLDLSSEWERYASEWMPIKDLDGLEYFLNLESLDLSDQAITDVTPLAGLKQLTLLALGGNPIADLAPLDGLTNLEMLILTGCTAQDYSPLANLTGLEYLRLDNSTIADAAPLASLTSLKRLYLEGCKLNYSPLGEIYPSLEDKDFIVATTLAEYGFVMDGAQAIYDGEQVSVRINHIDWGTPAAMGAENCVWVVFATDEYKVAIGYYPEQDAYVAQAYRDGEIVVNYVYNVADGSVNFSAEDRERFETHLRTIFPDAKGEDLLLEPVSFYNAALDDTLGMTATALFALPFEPPSLKGFGFLLNEETAAYEYQEHEPHDMHISIYNPELNNGPGNCNVEFYDDDFNGFSLLIFYFKDTGRYAISLYKDGTEAAYEIYPATNEYGTEYPDSETVNQMFNDAFETQDKEYIYKPLDFFEQAIANRFNMSIDELYALPIG